MLLPAADVNTEPMAIVTRPSGKLDPRRTKHLPTVDIMGRGRITYALSPDAWPDSLPEPGYTGHEDHSGKDRRTRHPADQADQLAQREQQ